MNDWTRTKELLADALELEPERRSAFLERACGADEDLRRRVTSLLEVDERARSFLETPAIDEPDRWLPELSNLRAGTVVDGFRIVRLVGVGGSGLVYEAQQLDPPRRVALKVVATSLARFELESRVLAALEHPGIAKVFSVGRLDEGDAPYLAVEWIPDALAVDRYARQVGFGTLARVDLFTVICDAVDHGHQRGVVHRDLKPANLLVDGEGRPRVIDFGIAKEIDCGGATRTGDLLGTVAYMSPEQCEARPRDADPRADVYSLGVVLFELLTGRRPLDIDGRALPEALRLIREDPPRMALAEGLADDLVAILARALEKDPARRYADAGELAADLRRFRDHLPVEARAPSLSYHARLFLHRNRSRAMACTAIFVVIVAGAIGTTLQATRAAEIERHERARAEQVTDFLLSVLALAQPTNAGGLDRPLRTLLDDAGARIDTELADLPAERAEIHDTIAMAYRELGLFEEAAAHLESSLEALRSTPDLDERELIGTLDNLGEVLVSAGRGERAVEVLHEAAAIHERHPDLPAFLRAITTNRLSGALLATGDLTGAEEHARAALFTYRATFGDEHRSVAAALRSLSDVLRARGDLAGACEASAQVLEIELGEFGADSLEVALARGRVGCLLAATGRTEQARPLLELAVTGLARFVPEEHPDLEATRLALAATE